MVSRARAFPLFPSRAAVAARPASAARSASRAAAVARRVSSRTAGSVLRDPRPPPLQIRLRPGHLRRVVAASTAGSASARAAAAVARFTGRSALLPPPGSDPHRPPLSRPLRLHSPDPVHIGRRSSPPPAAVGRQNRRPSLLVATAKPLLRPEPPPPPVLQPLLTRMVKPMLTLSWNFVAQLYHARRIAEKLQPAAKLVELHGGHLVSHERPAEVYFLLDQLVLKLHWTAKDT